jgi:hypothetical protein
LLWQRNLLPRARDHAARRREAREEHLSEAAARAGR